jgi:hypothetical protein
MNFGPREQVVLTPEWLYGLLNARFGPFDFDPAPYPRPRDFDGLAPTTPWGKCNFVNPPYNDIESWLTRALHELHAHGNTSVFLLPARPNTHWWTMHVAGRLRVYNILRFIRFRGYPEEYPIATCVVWVSAEPFEATHMRVVIQRPLDVMNAETPSIRATHTVACARYPGKFVNVDTGEVEFAGPVCPSEPVGEMQDSFRTFTTKTKQYADDSGAAASRKRSKLAAV